MTSRRGVNTFIEGGGRMERASSEAGDYESKRLDTHEMV